MPTAFAISVTQFPRGEWGKARAIHTTLCFLARVEGANTRRVAKKKIRNRHRQYMTSQLSQYRRLATATFLLALVHYFYDAQWDPTPRKLGWLRTVSFRNQHNESKKAMFLEEEEKVGLGQIGDNLKSNTTHAFMIDSRTGRQWLVEKQSMEHYEAEFIDLVDRKYRTKNTSSQLDILNSLGLGAVLEMEDGREYKCLASFHEQWRDELWRKADLFSGEPFLEWLDYGSGRDLNSAICDRERLNRRRYQMLNRTELETSLVEFRNNTYAETPNDISDNDNQSNTTLLTTTSLFNIVQAVFTATEEPVPPGLWLSVLDLNHNFYIFQGGKIAAPDQPFDYWKRGHGSVTGGRPVLYAGEMMIDRQGRVDSIVPDSGHYRPKLQHSKALYRWIHGIVGSAAQTTIDWRPARSATELERTVWNTLFDDDDEI